MPWVGLSIQFACVYLVALLCNLTKTQILYHSWTNNVSITVRLNTIVCTHLFLCYSCTNNVSRTDRFHTRIWTHHPIKLRPPVTVQPDKNSNVVPPLYQQCTHNWPLVYQDLNSPCFRPYLLYQQCFHNWPFLYHHLYSPSHSSICFSLLRFFLRSSWTSTGSRFTSCFDKFLFDATFRAVWYFSDRGCTIYNLLCYVAAVTEIPDRPESCIK